MINSIIVNFSRAIQRVGEDNLIFYIKIEEETLLTFY